jgi:membrane protein YdbS with pleckstrin-like domain
MYNRNLYIFLIILKNITLLLSLNIFLIKFFSQNHFQKILCCFCFIFSIFYFIFFIIFVIPNKHKNFSNKVK